MKITDIRTHVVEAVPQRTWLFIEVLTDEGRVGLGEASQTRNAAGVIRDLAELRPQYVGHNPFDLIERRSSLLRWPYVGRTLFAAVSGLEQALWDLIGKRLGVPVHQLLGGRCREAVRAYANIGYALDGTDPEQVAEVAARAAAQGFTAVKLYPFGERPPGGPDGTTERRWVDLGVARVQAVREAVGPDVEVLVDLMHQFLEVAEAKRVARLLEPFELFWIEDPLQADDPGRLAEYRRQIGPRLAGGAPHLTRQEFRPLLEAGALDVVMPDVKWLGGILEAKKVAAMAEVYGMSCSPHNASGPVACAASVQLSATLSNFLILEYAWGAPGWRDELCRGTERIENGMFVLSNASGLGVQLDSKVAERYRPD